MRNSLPPIGILSLKGTLVVGEGSIFDPKLLPGPHMKIEVQGATSTEIVERPELLISAYEAAAQSLESGGAEMLVSNCGLSMIHQSAVTQRAGKPTIMSALLLLPLLWRIFGGGVGILTYDAKALSSARLRQECGWTPEIRPAIGEVRNLESWLSLEHGSDTPLPVEQMERDLLEVVQSTIAGGGNRVILVECTAMLPYIGAIRKAAGTPVFDVVRLTSFIRSEVDSVGQ